MREVSELERSKKLLIESDAFYVMVSHKELDTLIASVMHVIELDSDKEHREALKGELKWRLRNWLDQEYSDAGYRNHRIEEGTEIVNIQESKPLAYSWIQAQQEQ